MSAASKPRQGDCRFGYADPPYPGMADFYKDHPDYGGEVDHAQLIVRLEDEFSDGWVLHTASTTLRDVLALCPDRARVLAWVKPFASWKKGVYPAYAWEPVIMAGGRNDYGARQTVPDFVAEPITLQRGLTGAKPERVCMWLFDCLGARPDDELVDLFPGSGAVGRAWTKFQAEPRLAFPLPEQDAALFPKEAKDAA
jgi:hypothetical protein